MKVSDGGLKIMYRGFSRARGVLLMVYICTGRGSAFVSTTTTTWTQKFFLLVYARACLLVCGLTFISSYSCTSWCTTRAFGAKKVFFLVWTREKKRAPRASGGTYTRAGGKQALYIRLLIIFVARFFAPALVIYFNGVILYECNFEKVGIVCFSF